MNERNLSPELEQLYQLLKQIDEGKQYFEPDEDNIESWQKFKSTVRCLKKADSLQYILGVEETCDGVYVQGLTFDGMEVLNNPQKLLIDNNPKAAIVMSTTINQHVTNSTIHGSVIAAEKIEHSFNSLQESKTNDETKVLLEKLLNEIKLLNEKVPATQAPAIEKMAKSADTLVNESKSATPDHAWYELSFKGIKEAVTTIGEMAKPVWEVAEKLSPLLLTI